MNKQQKNKLTVILSVTNDLVTDRRVDKVIQTLLRIGFLPVLIGRKLNNSKNINRRNYQTIRMNLFFTKGAKFYAEYNLHLFFLLIFKKTDILLANDLDTLLANYSAYIIKRYIFRQKVFLVYDSHELFTELPELNGRKFAKNTWILIEKMILPKIKYAYTVCKSIAYFYNEKYGISMQVIRNLPQCSKNTIANEKAILLKQSFKGKKIILYQGALNIGRGLEQAVLAMQYIENTVLLIIGEGDIENHLKNMVNNRNLNDKVYFTGKIPLNELNAYTQIADAGLVLQEDLSLSYRYVLPNRLFDYMHAEIPVLASALPEIEHIISKHQTGILTDNLNPESIANKLNKLFSDAKKTKAIKENIRKVKNKYCWESEENKLKAIFKVFIAENTNYTRQ
jgi:glycosyltransferase involved in cell wall biosynthesis